MCRLVNVKWFIENNKKKDTALSTTNHYFYTYKSHFIGTTGKNKRKNSKILEMASSNGLNKALTMPDS